MKLVYAVITYNRLFYLIDHMASWEYTRNKEHEWILILVDDGSEDGTWDFIKNYRLKNKELEIIRLQHKRRGVHYATNQVFKWCIENNFDLGFMAQDDIYFIGKGWDDQYIESIEKSGYEHLCYFNKRWAIQYGREQHLRKYFYYDKEKGIQSHVVAFNSFGCFWTFTPNILKTVGYFDLKNFGLCGNGHTDFSKRCCRAKFNDNCNFMDAINSENFIAMQNYEYVGAIRDGFSVDAQFIGLPNRGHKGRILGKLYDLEEPNRLYIPYNEIPWDMNGKKLK